MENRRPGRAPNYTNAAMVMLGINLLILFTALWAAYGLIPALLLALVLNHGVERLAHARGAVPLLGFVSGGGARR